MKVRLQLYWACLVQDTDAGPQVLSVSRLSLTSDLRQQWSITRLVSSHRLVSGYRLIVRTINIKQQIVIIMTCVHNHCDGEIIVLSAPRDTLAIIASCCTCVLVRASNEPSRRLKFYYKHKEGSPGVWVGLEIYGNQKSMPIHFDFCNSASISHWFTMG